MCRTFSLPEIKRSDLYAAAAKAADILDNAAAFDSSNNNRPSSSEAWSDEDLMDLLKDFPDELEMDLDFMSDLSEDSSVTHQSVSDDSLTSNNTAHQLMVPFQPTVLPTYDFGPTYGLHAVEEGFVALPCPKPFSHLSLRTPDMIREEKLNSMDPFVGALNEGDLFSLYSICQSACEANVQFSSQSCGFHYTGTMAVMSFWTMLFEEHYQGRIQCLSRRMNSTLRSMAAGMPALTDASVYESADFVLKLEGCRLSEFRHFELFRSLMSSGYVHDNLALPEIINLAEAFYKQFQSNMTPSHQIFNMVYLFEVNLRFHALNHSISHWNIELIAVQSK